MPDDPWAVTVETWEGPIICCASADEFSARDWLRNVLSGSNLVPQGGIGAFVARRLGEGLDIRLATPVTRVALERHGRRVAVETPRGTITARLGHRHGLHRRAGGGRDRASIRRCRRRRWPRSTPCRWGWR